MKIVRGKVEFVDENNQKLKVIKEIDKIKEAEKVEMKNIIKEVLNNLLENLTVEET